MNLIKKGRNSGSEKLFFFTRYSKPNSRLRIKAIIEWAEAHSY